MRVNNNVKKILDENGLRQSDVAKKAGISYATINTAYNRRGNPSKQYKQKIVNAVNSLASKSYSTIDLFRKV